MESVLKYADTPLVSIITPAFNAETFIWDCLESVAKQKDFSFEHIIIDGGSTDNTMAIVKEYARSHEHVRYISEKDKGLYDAMNKGIGLAKGEWLHFLGSDDELYEDNTLAAIFSDEVSWRHDVLYGKVIYKNSRSFYGEEFNKEKIFQKNICHQAIFTKKKVFVDIGTFNIRYKVFADWDINLRLFSEDNISKRFINQVVAVYQEGGLSSWQADEDFFKAWPQVKNPFFDPATRLEVNHNIGKYGLNQLQSGEILKALPAIWVAAVRTREYKYYIKNSLFWLAKRFRII